MGRRGYPSELRQRGLDLVAAGRSELIAARRRIRQLEAELAVHRRAAELLKGASVPKGRGSRHDGHRRAPGEARLPLTRGVRVGLLRASLAATVLAILPHAWLTDLIRRVHGASRGTYGSRRVHAEFNLRQSVLIGHEAVELLMRRAGIQGISGWPKFRRVPGVTSAADPVERRFRRDSADELRVTDVTEHPTRQGKIYCAAVLDAWSRRTIGWSIDSSPTTALVTNALGIVKANDVRPKGLRFMATRGRPGVARTLHLEPTVATFVRRPWI